VNGVSVRLIIDTQIFVWFATGDRRLTRKVRLALEDEDNALCTSAVIAWEYSDLRKRGRFPPVARFQTLVEMLDLEVIDFPAACEPLVDALPELHRDPIDRMLVAHAIHADLTLITADRIIRDYPVRTIW